MNVPGSDIAMALAEHLSAIPEVRVHAYMPDNFKPPGIVVHQPSINWATSNRTFCTREFTFPVSIVVARTHDRSAQAELDRILTAIEARMDESTDSELLGQMRLMSATPENFSVSGVDLPGYSVTVEVIA
jgi:hypothetical protein